MIFVDVISMCVSLGCTGAGLVACIGSSIGVDDSCYDCICWVLSYAGNIDCEAPNWCESMGELKCKCGIQSEGGKNRLLGYL